MTENVNVDNSSIEIDVKSNNSIVEVSSEDLSKTLIVTTNTNNVDIYENLSYVEISSGSNVQGPQGPKGDAAATIVVGSTTTVNPGVSASVTNSGSSSAVVLNFSIPKGEKGDTGEPGQPGTIDYEDLINKPTIPSLTITQVDTSGTATETYADITTIAFDEDSGFDVTNPSTGVAKVAMNSTFKYWEVDGIQGLTAVGLDTVNFKSGTGIDIVADGQANPQELTISVDPDVLALKANVENPSFNLTLSDTTIITTTSSVITRLNPPSILRITNPTTEAFNLASDYYGVPSQLAQQTFQSSLYNGIINQVLKDGLDIFVYLSQDSGVDFPNGTPISSTLLKTISSAELGYLEDVRSNIQTQIDNLPTAYTTDYVSEGSNNKYFTDVRAVTAVGNSLNPTLTTDSDPNYPYNTRIKVNYGSGLLESGDKLIVDDTTIATKAYANSVAGKSSFKESAFMGSPTNINLSTFDNTGFDTFPGQLNGLWRVVLLNQTEPSENGIYRWDGITNSLVRTDDATFTPTGGGGTDKLKTGSIVYIEGGTYANKFFTAFINLLTYPFAVEWTEFGASGDTLPSQTGNNGKFLKTDGTNTSWDTVDLSSKQDVVSGVSSTEIGYLDGVTSAIQTQIDSNLPKSGGTMTGAIAMGNSKITGLATPTADADAATKAYVDLATAGLNVHASVKAATTSNINLNNELEAGDILDGVTLAHNHRVLVKNQNTAADNGIYIIQPNGAATRATDYDSTPEVDAGDFIYVESGTVNAKTGWVQTETVTTVGSDDIAFTQFSGAGTYTAGNGLTLTGSAFSVDTSITQTRVSGVTDTEIGYLDGVTSNIQTQLDSKGVDATPTVAGVVLGQSNQYRTALGYNAGKTSTVTDYNTAIGAYALSATSTGGGYNTAVGAGALQESTGNNSTAVGFNALSLATGNLRNTAVGAESLATLANGNDYNRNTAIGYLSGWGVSSSIESIFIGYQSGYGSTSNLYSIYLGGQATSSSASQEIVIGTLNQTKFVVPGLSINWTTTSFPLPSYTSIGNVSATEIGYLDGVTSAIQTQIDAKAPLASPTFTGTVNGITKSMVGLGSVDNTADTAKPVSTAQQTALNLKANLSGPTFTGTVTLPSTTSIGNVSATELGYIDGVTSAIQTQLNNKVSAAAPLTLTQSANNANYPLTIASANQQGGGVGYSDILRLTNTKSGATNINKYFRLTDGGNLEIVNSAYSATIFSLGNDGAITSVSTYNGATIGDTGWIAVSSFANSFSAVAAVAYRKINNVVYLRGNLTGGTAGTGAFTLPIGYRPADTVVIPVQQYGTANINYVTVGTDGVVAPNASSAWLSSIIFPVG